MPSSLREYLNNNLKPLMRCGLLVDFLRVEVAKDVFDNFYGREAFDAGLTAIQDDEIVREKWGSMDKRTQFAVFILAATWAWGKLEEARIRDIG